MNPRTDIPPAMYDDEVVLFIADRYHTTTRRVMQCFIEQDTPAPEMAAGSSAFYLEENEMAILRDMMAAYR